MVAGARGDEDDGGGEAEQGSDARHERPDERRQRGDECGRPPAHERGGEERRAHDRDGCDRAERDPGPAPRPRHRRVRLRRARRVGRRRSSSPPPPAADEQEHETEDEGDRGDGQRDPDRALRRPGQLHGDGSGVARVHEPGVRVAVDERRRAERPAGDLRLPPVAVTLTEHEPERRPVAAGAHGHLGGRARCRRAPPVAVRSAPARPGADASPAAFEVRTTRSTSSPVSAPGGLVTRWLPRARVTGPAHGSMPSPRRASAGSPVRRKWTARPSMCNAPAQSVGNGAVCGAGATPGIVTSEIDTGGNATGAGGTGTATRASSTTRRELVRGRRGERDRHRDQRGRGAERDARAGPTAAGW